MRGGAAMGGEGGGLAGGMPELSGALALLLILAALMHASWNAMVKASPDRLLLLSGITVAYGAGAAICLLWLPLPLAGAWPFLLLSACVHQVYRYALAWMYDHGDLSRSYPVARGAAPLITTLAMASMGEVPSLPDLAALALVGAGLVGLGLSAGSAAGQGAAQARGTEISRALLIAAMIACYTVLDGFGARRSGSALSYTCWLSVIDSGAFTAGIVRRKGGAWLAGASRGQSVIGGLLSLGAYAIALYATTRGAVGVVAALRESSVIFAALIGALWFREPLGAARVAAAVTVAAGLLLLQAV